MPIISVILPIYNVEKYLEKCINSLLGQTFQNFEIILVDDGSPDRCGQICDYYQKKSQSDKNMPNIIAIHQKNGGLSAARNTGIEWALQNSNSEWIAFVDSDDYVNPFYLEKMYKSCIETDSSMCMCDFLSVNDEGDSVEVEHDFPNGVYDSKDDFFKLLYSNWRIVVAWNKLYKKEVLSSLRFEVGKIHEDEFMIHNLFDNCKRICFIPDTLYYYVIREGSIMTSSKIATKKLNYFEALIQRYNLCKLKNYPIDQRFISIEYLTEMKNLKKFIDKNNNQQYKDFMKHYRKIYIQENNNSIKSKVRYDLFFLYNIYRNEKVKEK